MWFQCRDHRIFVFQYMTLLIWFRCHVNATTTNILCTYHKLLIYAPVANLTLCLRVLVLLLHLISAGWVSTAGVTIANKGIFLWSWEGINYKQEEVSWNWSHTMLHEWTHRNGIRPFHHHWCQLRLCRCKVSCYDLTANKNTYNSCIFRPHCDFAKNICDRVTRLPNVKGNTNWDAGPIRGMFIGAMTIVTPKSRNRAAQMSYIDTRDFWHFNINHKAIFKQATTTELDTLSDGGCMSQIKWHTVDVTSWMVHRAWSLGISPRFTSRPMV